MENARVLLQAIQGWKIAIPIFTTWPEGHAPFDLPLVFETQTARDHGQQVLQQHSVYCPVEWVCHTADTTATDLSSRILSIPIDHRYGRDDMERIVTALLTVRL